MPKITHVAFPIIFLLSFCTIRHRPSGGSTISIVSKNASLDVANLKISVQIKSDDSNESNNPKVLIWDGKEQNQIPDYGMYGAKWFIN